jgi:predicted nucleic acid-binding protein
MDDKVSKNDLQYLLSNKISVEELQKVMENKANHHEVNLELQSLNSKVEEIYRDVSKRLQNCALQKDFTYLQTIIETKANIEDVNESLAGKANKQSVANALHRKANRSDVD